jgi:hypothetical protein
MFYNVLRTIAQGSARAPEPTPALAAAPALAGGR